MSYCRFSSDDFRCDLYCYSTDDAWVTHVAGSRIVGDIPKIDFSCLLKTEDDPTAAERFVEQHRAQMDFLNTAEREPIDLPYSGMTFEDGTIEDFYRRVLYLSEVGYTIPKHLLETIRSEFK